MNAPETPRNKARSADSATPFDPARALELVTDPFGIGQAPAASAQGWLRHPWELVQAWGALGSALAGVQADWWRCLSEPAPPSSVAVDADGRFSDPLWSLPPYALLRDAYLTYTHWLEASLFHAPGVDAPTRRRSAFWARQWLNAWAPSNFLALNPVALQKAVDSGGLTLAQGFAHFLEDIEFGDVPTVDAGPFRVGVNLANTPGAVVFRNHLVEVIQYAATRQRTRTVPIVLIAPWINKYYILDLSPAKSLVRHLVDQGFDVFVTSWRNPNSGDAGTRFDDYLVGGTLPALEVARDICRTPVVHAAGYCLGGTALAAAMAWCNRGSEAVPVAHWTLLTTLTDFSRPGAIEVFLDERSLAYLDRLMARQGFLDGRDMGRAFRMLRANSLIWQFAVQRYLYGERLPAFDVLYWNADSTRMPRAMHRYYLREFYLNNRLVERDGLTLAGRPIDLRRIRQPLYMVGTEEDHIAPWKATFTLCGLVAAPVRYVLTTSGHILGIINPPETSKRAFVAGAAGAEDPVAWQSRQQRVSGSWWKDWVEWLDERCGPWRDAPALGSARFPKLADAPGCYVFET
ncbi:MAG TPA: alpha/beta fold hydrolase [Burkholderiales bacterium]|nr:alpha/beta fold hydrolase [Burkholderiales bacterium]